eukprot:726132-Prymnesium_polylepis.1
MINDVKIEKRAHEIRNGALLALSPGERGRFCRGLARAQDLVGQEEARHRRAGRLSDGWVLRVSEARP